MKVAPQCEAALLLLLLRAKQCALFPNACTV
jgi:hypothetical protein